MRWSGLQRALTRVPPSAAEFPVDRATVAGILAAAGAENRAMLTEPEAKSVISAYGVPTPEIAIARSDDEVAEIARRMLENHKAIVLKIYSRTITHKSDIGGVVLDIRSVDAALEAAAAIRARLDEASPGTIPEGFSIQPMIARPSAHELNAGMHLDQSFGPTLLFGAGGTSVEIVDDTATGLAPLDAVLAGDMIEATRVGRLLAGYRDRPAADREAIVRAMLGLSQLTVDFPAIRGIDINPLLADDRGVMALDARIEIDPARATDGPPNPLLAIRPYPSGWEKTVTPEKTSFVLRPSRPAAAELFPAFMARIEPEDLRLRFLSPLKALSPRMMVQLTQLDYDRDIAFLALEVGNGDMAGVVRYSSDPDHEAAEFGVLVRSDLHGRGLGTALMRQLVDYARADGLQRLDGLILRENARMVTLCQELGFAIEPDPDDPNLVRARLPIAR